jgi:predicted regulator of Ras-like GTPase activity (Roadblock/LC7/MglB family)
VSGGSLAAVERWVEQPLRRFVEDARLRRTLLLHPSGQVVAQQGFARSVDVMSACALAAGIRASAGELGRMLDGRPFGELFHAGDGRQLYLADVATPRGPYVLLAVFDAESSLGLVRLYFAELAEDLAAAAPAPVAEPKVLPSGFEQELNRNLAVLFGRA